MGNVQATMADGRPFNRPPCPSELEPTFDPNFGFPNGRKERVMIATKEEMISAKLPIADRGYCAHKLIQYRGCRADNFPFVYKCNHERHDLLNCEYDDYILRMKEFERERRLKDRQKRLDKKAAAGQ